ncbi:MAG: Rpn family recombination-promoting nuclease/putative transposase [Oscillospiraceae bacterium]|nr:Rpn family recombination-promoting nuclease/putative transposase [Oscillospiraceae bacterium]
MEVRHEDLIGTFEQKRELVKQFNLMHDDFFAVVMRDKEPLEVVLRILLQKPDLVVQDVRVQYVMRNLGSHSVILDVFAEDSTGKLYNVEVQVENRDDHQKRVRYYQANMDTAFLNKGRHYSELPDLYLIFIASFDLFGDGLVCYEVERTLKHNRKVIDNGVHELYFNTKADDSSEIAKLLHYFEHTDDSNDEYGALSDAVKRYKNTREGVSHVCDAVEKYGDQRAERAAAHAKALERIELVANVMKNLNCPLEQALSILGITPAEYQSCVDLLNERKSA